MDKKFSLLKKILPLLEDYESEGLGTDDVSDFGRWIIAHTEPMSKVVMRENGAMDAGTLMKGFGNPRAYISFLLYRLNKYARMYIKDALKDSPLVGVDDFSFLASLMYVPSMGKSALITTNVNEIPSGMDVIKRLVTKGLAEEFPDPNDKRAKQIRISKEGRNEFVRVIQNIEKVGMVVVGNTSENEQWTLAHLMEKLDLFHYEIFQAEKDFSADHITQKYLG